AVFPRGRFEVNIFWDQALGRVILAILEWLDKHGPEAIEALLQGAIFVKPVCPNLRAFCLRYYPRGLQPLASELAGQIGNFGLVQDVNLGLQALIGKSKDPAFRNILRAFRTKFGDTSRQIRVLKKYKELHNSLHIL